jgi:hypothetical protein
MAMNNWFLILKLKVHRLFSVVLLFGNTKEAASNLAQLARDNGSLDDE